MKKKIKILLLSLLLILTSTINVNATGGVTANLKATEEIEENSKLTVVLHVSSEEGINGISGKVNFDESKLKLTGINVKDTKIWVSFQENDNKSFSILNNSGDKGKDFDIVEINFELTDKAKVGDKLQIKVMDLMVGTFAKEDDTIKIDQTETNVTVKEKKVDNNPVEGSGNNPVENQDNKPAEDPDNKPVKNPDNKPVEDSDNKPVKNPDNKPVETPDHKPGEKPTPKPEQNKKEPSKDTTTSDKKIPYTGAINVIGLIGLLSVISIIVFIKYKAYKTL